MLIILFFIVALYVSSCFISCVNYTKTFEWIKTGTEVGQCVLISGGSLFQVVCIVDNHVSQEYLKL